MKSGGISQEYFPLGGGLDLVTPQIAMPSGKVFDAQNYEPEISGGYGRINGFERSDGRVSPTSADYWILTANVSGVVVVGSDINGQTSGATARVLAYPSTGRLVLGRVTGTFQVGENLRVTTTVFGTATSSAQIAGEPSPSNDADYMLLAANDRRADISPLPGSGVVRGVAIYNDTVYAFRDNVGGTAGNMYKQTASGWQQITFGSEILFQTLQTNSTVTITIASPAVVSYASHPFVNGQAVQLVTTGALPTGLTAGYTYYIVNAAAGTFQLSLTAGGAAINTSGTQSGTHTCVAMGSEIVAGTTITGVTSGATATVKAALLRTGTWTTGAAGSLVIDTIVGTFQSNEALKVSGILKVTTTSVATAITRAPGGNVEYVVANFTGTTAGIKMYGCDGVNPAFEFDGTTYVPIRTGMSTDTPSHVIAHKFHLFLSFQASVQLSATGSPYSWSVVTGAAEIATGDVVTGFIPTGGSNAGSSLAIFTKTRTYILYGDSTANFNLVPSIYELGYSARTMQPVSNNTYGLTPRGVQGLISTLTYGDFDYESVSFPINPLMVAKRGLETCSTSLRQKDQYRLYFSDGTGIVMGLTGDRPAGILPLNYGKVVRCMTTQTLSNGQEVTYFGSDDGYVYQDSVGTSFDGSPIEAWVRPAFNHSKSPQIRKKYRRAVLEVKAYGFSKIDVSYDLGYGDPNVTPPLGFTNQSIYTGGYWDQFTWESFTWDAKIFNTVSVSLVGVEKNISFLFYSNRAQDSKHVVQGITLMFTPLRLER